MRYQARVPILWGRRLQLLPLLLVLLVAAGGSRLLASPPTASAGQRLNSDPCTIHWTALDGNFNYAGNWTPNVVPQPGMHVCIDAPGSYTVRLYDEVIVVDPTTNPPTTVHPSGQSVIDYLDIKANNGSPTLSIRASYGHDAGLVVNHDLYSSGQIQMTTDSCLYCNDDILDVRGTATIDTGGELSSQPGNGGRREISGAWTNYGTVSVATATTMLGSFDNRGSLQVYGPVALTGGYLFQQHSGDLAIDPNNQWLQFTGAAVELLGGTLSQGTASFTGGTLTFGAAFAPGNGSAIQLQASTTLIGDIPAGLTVTTMATYGYPASLTETGSFTNSGSIVFDGSNCNSGCAGSTIAALSGTFTNAGSITVTALSGGGHLKGNVTNTATGTVTTNTALDLVGTAGVSMTFTNAGTLAIAGKPGSTFTVSGAGNTFVQNAGAHLTGGDNFALTYSAFTVNGGTITGTPSLNAPALAFGSGAVATGTLAFRNTGTLAGDIPSGITLDVQSQNFSTTTVNVAADVTNAGIVLLDTDGCAGGCWDTVLAMGPAATFTNAGTLHVAGTGGGLRRSRGRLINTGTLTVETGVTLTLAQLFANHGSVKTVAVAPSATGGSIINEGPLTFLQYSGTIDFANGSLQLSDGGMQWDGGALAGVPLLRNEQVSLTTAPPQNPTTLTLRGNSNLGSSGVPAGVTLDLQAEPYTNATLIVASMVAAGSIPNAGTILLDNTACSGQPCGDSILAVTIGSLTNTGTITAANGAVGATRRLQGNLVNNGLLTLAAPFSVDSGTLTNAGSGSVSGTYPLAIAAGATLSGAGTLAAPVSNLGTIAPTGLLSLSGGLSEGGSAHLAVAIGGATAGTGYGQLTLGGAFALAGTLNLSLTGGYAPANGTVFTLLKYGSASGSFATVNGLSQPGGITLTPNTGPTSYMLTAGTPAGAAAALTSPANHSTLSSNAPTFSWSAATPTPVQYVLDFGTSLGAADLGEKWVGTALSYTTVGGLLPHDGSTFYLRLLTNGSPGAWVSNDYSFTACTCQAQVPAAMTSPANGGQLTTPYPTFAWTAASPAPLRYVLDFASSQANLTAGNSDLVPERWVGTTTSYLEYALPQDGRTVYVRLWTQFGPGVWSFNDYSYTLVKDAVVTSQASGSAFTASAPTLTWNAATPAPVRYVLDFASSQANLDAGTPDIAERWVGTLTTYLAWGMPTDGSTVYLRLWTQYAVGLWASTDSHYTAVRAAVLQTPTSGTLTGASRTWTWNVASPVQEYELLVGSSPGGSDIAARFPGTGTSVNTPLPANNSTVYVTLWTHVGPHDWVGQSYSFTSAP